MLSTLMPAERRLNDAVQGFGLSQDLELVGLEALNTSPQIPPGKSRVVSFPLLCGLMNQNKKITSQIPARTPDRIRNMQPIYRLRFRSDSSTCRR